MRGGGVAIYTKVGLTATEINHNLTPQMEVVIGEVTSETKNKIIIIKVESAYIPASQICKALPLENLKALLQAGDIILGDLKAKSPQWDDSQLTPDSAGAKLEKAIDETHVYKGTQITRTPWT